MGVEKSVMCARAQRLELVTRHESRAHLVAFKLNPPSLYKTNLGPFISVAYDWDEHLDRLTAPKTDMPHAVKRLRRIRD